MAYEAPCLSSGTGILPVSVQTEPVNRQNESSAISSEHAVNDTV